MGSVTVLTRQVTPLYEDLYDEVKGKVFYFGDGIERKGKKFEFNKVR